MNRKERRIQKAGSRHAPHIEYMGQTYGSEELFAMAVQQERLRNDAQAQAMYRAILARLPGHTLSLNNLGVLMHKADAVHEAVVLYRAALKQDPGYVLAWHNLGDALLSLGQIKEAEQAFLEALRLKPDFARSLYSLTHMRRYSSPEHEDAIHIQRLLQTATVDWEYLYFALGKIYDDCAMYDQAFACYHRANRICRETIVCDRDAIRRTNDNLKAVFTREFFSLPRPTASPSSKPVFIVGMPRSGTTLLSAILSRHPAIDAAGELPTMIECSNMLQALIKSDRPYPQAMQDLTPEAMVALAQHYTMHLNQRSRPEAVHVIDKHPINFSCVGFIATLFPNARIIHCTRDPLDTCLSNYFQYLSRDFYYAFDLEDTAHFYAGYDELMQHWREVLPGKMLEVRYEDMVTDTEQVARQALAYLGLDWDERCLSPEANRHSVRTASVWQVRQPVYASSVARWKHYEKYLQGVKSILRLA